MGVRKRRYTAATVCLTLLLIWLLQNPYFPSAIRLILIAVALLGLIRWTAAIVLVLVQTDLALFESGWRAGGQPPALIIAVGTVALLMVLSRLRSAQELTGVRSIVQLLSAMAGRPPVASDDKDAESTRQNRHAGAEEPLWITFLSLCMVLAAGQLLQLVPVDRLSVREYGLTPTGLRTIQLGLILFTTWILLTLPLTELRWRRLTPNQAGLYLRTHFVSWLHRDLRAVERRKRRLKNKRLRQFRRAARSASGQALRKAD